MTNNIANQELNKHVNSKHQDTDKSENTFKCTKCDELYCSKHDLDNHMETLHKEDSNSSNEVSLSKDN